MKTIRLLYPDYRSGGLDTYYFGAQLMAHILPANPQQPLLSVNLPPPDGEPRPIHDGIAAKEEVFAGIRAAADIRRAECPDKIITIGGSCIVSLGFVVIRLAQRIFARLAQRIFAAKTADARQKAQ